MGQKVSSSLLLSLQKSEYFLNWMNKVWMKFPLKRLLIKWNLFALQYLNDIFKYTLVKNRSILKVFIFDTTHYSLKSKQNPQMIIIIIINKYVKTWKLKSCSWAKKVARLKKNKVDLKSGWHMWRSCYWSWIFQQFLLHIKILTYIRWLLPFDMDT